MRSLVCDLSFAQSRPDSKGLVAVVSCTLDKTIYDVGDKGLIGWGPAAPYVCDWTRDSFEKIINTYFTPVRMRKTRFALLSPNVIYKYLM